MTLHYEFANFGPKLGDVGVKQGAQNVDFTIGIWKLQKLQHDDNAKKLISPRRNPQQQKTRLPAHSYYRSEIEILSVWKKLKRENVDIPYGIWWFYKLEVNGL